MPLAPSEPTAGDGQAESTKAKDTAGELPFKGRLPAEAATNPVYTKEEKGKGRLDLKSLDLNVEVMPLPPNQNYFSALFPLLAINGTELALKT